MAGQAKIEELTTQEHRQDCGCGCGGTLCGTARQELIWVDSPKAVAAKETAAGECDCSCGCDDAVS